ncbi:class III extradiol ring-cleavage dioxygenase [Marisediminitalea sp.]|uniref:DODA-type extradiol aromatic ring-opening family dioxygenase n=1 Tax=Marisediminitalea sp. TaxID=2662268 RepID=UPI0035133E2D
MSTTKQIVFISHGGGPLPLLNDPAHAALVEQLKTLPQQLRKPKAIIVISAHWEADEIRVTDASAPALLYDYYGFPPESYQLKYPCKGEPELAKSIVAELNGAGIPAKTESKRGLDHGVFVPLKLMYPEADIPVVQVSLSATLDPVLHLQVGEVLAQIPQDGLLIIGSGFSFHNMRAFFSPATVQTQQLNNAFEQWLKDSLSLKHSYASIRGQLTNWEQAPGARFCHPREEHLLPLHVCAGAAGQGTDNYEDIMVLNKRAGFFGWL